MICKNCGTTNEDGAKFCKSCGTAFGDTTENTVGNATVATTSNTANNAVNKIKAIPKKFMIIGLAIILGIIAIICVVVKAKSTINLDKYMTVSFEGYDGYGKATATIDWDAIESKYGDKIDFSDKANSDYGSLLEFMSPMDALEGCVSIELDKENGLSNGDEVSYTWNIDSDLTKYTKCKLKYKDGSIKVKDLEKIDTFDAFSNLTVEFDGVAPNGSVNLNYDGTELSVSDFSSDKYDGLSNGDTVTISIREDVVESLSESIGKIPESFEKEYTVEELNSYVTKASQINEESLEKLKQQAKDEYDSQVAKSWEDDETLESLTYIGNYLLTAKDEDTWGDNNQLYLVFKAKVHNTYAGGESSYDATTDIYWYIAYEDLIADKDGEVNIDYSTYKTPYDNVTVDSGVSDGWFGTKSWNYYGYETIDELYKAVVTSNANNFNHEDNVDESVAQ